MELPRPLWLAAKAEARAQGWALRDVVARLLDEWLHRSPSWRAFLEQQAAQPAARGRGAVIRR